MPDGAERALTAVGPLEVEARRGAVTSRHLQHERRDRVEEPAQLLRPGGAAAGLLEAEPQAAVAQRRPTARTSMRSACTWAVGSSHRSSLLRTARTGALDRTVGHGDADVDAPVRRAPPADEQVVVGAGIDAHEPRPARRAGLRRVGRRRARRRPGPRPRAGTGRCCAATTAPTAGARREHERPRHDLHEPSHGCDPTAAGHRRRDGRRSPGATGHVVAQHELPHPVVVHQEHATAS